MSRKGIDVSEHQGVIDWDKVKSSGIEFAILRAGYGRNNIDKQFRRNIEECKRVGMPIGIYWFSYALNEEMARAEAQYCVNAIKGYTLSYPIYFDFEYDSINYCRRNGINVSKSLATNMVRAFCKEVERLGYYAGNYTNQDFAYTKFNMEQLKDIDVWYAYYNSSCNRSCGVWQYAENGRVTGINGSAVDMNFANVDYPSIINKGGKKKMDLIVYYSEIDRRGAEYLADHLSLPIVSLDKFNKNPKLKENSGKVYMIGGHDKPTDNTELITGSDRFSTVRAVIDYITK